VLAVLNRLGNTPGVVVNRNMIEQLRPLLGDSSIESAQQAAQYILYDVNNRFLELSPRSVSSGVWLHNAPTTPQFCKIVAYRYLRVFVVGDQKFDIALPNGKSMKSVLAATQPGNWSSIHVAYFREQYLRAERS
jgi:hypothetical protein